MRYIGGIDPGLTGALAVLDFEEYKLHLWDTPVVEVRVGDAIRKRCDPHAYADAFTLFPLDYVTIENVHAMPNDGAVGSFTFGKVTGIAIGIAAALDIPMPAVSPAKWKMQLQVPADKKLAKHRASELFPKCTQGWSREKDHGRAEAALIALYSAIVAGATPNRPFTLGLVNGTPLKRK